MTLQLMLNFILINSYKKIFCKARIAQLVERNSEDV
jgi:hypothetical protein